MKKILKDLIELQSVDDGIDELKRNGGNLPDVIQTMDEEMEKKRNDLEEKKDKLEELKGDLRKASTEREGLLKALKKYESQLSLVKTNKEYEALLKEIDYAEFRILELEEDIDKIKKDIEEQTQLVEETEKKLEEDEAEYTEKRAKFKKDLETLEDKLEVKYDERKRVKVRLPKRVISEYERIRRGLSGKAVVPVKNDACGGCFYNFPPQVVFNAKKQDRLIHCESCGRLVVWLED